MILWTSRYGVEEIPGGSTGYLEANWAEFLAQFDNPDFSGKRIPLFGLGAQERYPERFASSLMRLYEVFKGYGAELAGSWSTEGYTFEQSAAVVEGRFDGLVIDQRTQSIHTDERIDGWPDQVKPLLLEKIGTTN